MNDDVIVEEEEEREEEEEGEEGEREEKAERISEEATSAMIFITGMIEVAFELICRLRAIGEDAFHDCEFSNSLRINLTSSFTLHDDDDDVEDGDDDDGE